MLRWVVASVLLMGSTLVTARALRGQTADTSSAVVKPAATPSAETKVNEFLSYNAETHTVKLRLVAGFNHAQGGFNFNGGSQGDQTITVPLNWQVSIAVTNQDAVPHSAIIIESKTPVPSAPDRPTIPRAYTAHLVDGLAPLKGKDTMNFKASRAGKYFITCGVPGHGPSGMYITLAVSNTATVPTYTMANK